MIGQKVFARHSIVDREKEALLHGARYALEEFFLALSAFGEESIWSWRKWRFDDKIRVWAENKILALRANEKLSPFSIMGLDDIKRERVKEFI